jgi:SET domain-containing protein
MPDTALYQGALFVQKSPIHGYGVFAAQDIAAGTVVEECYCLMAAKEDSSFPNHYFDAGEESALPLGYGCIYNHSPTPNVAFYYNPKTQLMVFTAIKAIKRGEELCSSYGKHWFASRDLHTRTFSGWRRAYQLLTGPLLRAALSFAGIWGIIEVIRYWSLNRFISF